jgi:DNA-binding NarL/FixJ family response regulator
MTNVLVVEDHDIMRMMVKSYLTQLDDDLQVVWEAASGEEALELLDGTAPDLILLDVSLPGMSGLDVLERIYEICPTALILILSGHIEAKYARQAIERGANGYVVKGDMQQVPRAIRDIIDGKTYLSPELRDIEV